MQTVTSKREIWTGRILTGLVTFGLLGSAIGKFAGAAKMVEGLTRSGIPPAAIVPIGLLELTCLALFLIPRSALLGAFLLTGFFGGATVTHLIGGESMMPPLFIGLLVWTAAWFRIPELRETLPLRREREPFAGARGRQPLPSRG